MSSGQPIMRGENLEKYYDTSEGFIDTLLGESKKVKAVDDVTEATHVLRRDPSDEARGFTFERSERKTFTKRWNQTFRITESEWEPADAGEYTIGAGFNVENAEEKGLYSQTTVRLVEDQG